MDRKGQDGRAGMSDALAAHLAAWGLRPFTGDDAYFQWQRNTLSSRDLNELHLCVERKRSGQPSDEIAFYNLTADPAILPVLYSQRYGYYGAVGPLVAARLGGAQTVLDFGCGVGILTTFYAARYPDKTFVGLDRSPVSIEAARRKTEQFGLRNLRFECVDLDRQQIGGTYDCVVATHALLQAEQDPGIPSLDWTTFERAHDPEAQAGFEERTGLGVRLDQLRTVLAPGGRMLVFEKTRQLARRIPFQRSLAARGLSLTEQPVPVRYRTVEEISDDGPLYAVHSGEGQAGVWNEAPEPDEGLPFDPATFVSSESEEPLYENHHPSAQEVWRRLGDRSVVKEQTRTEPDGRQLHVELGRSAFGVYLYCANTYDQRQFVLVDPAKAAMVESYYQDIVGG